MPLHIGIDPSKHSFSFYPEARRDLEDASSPVVVVEEADLWAIWYLMVRKSPEEGAEGSAEPVPRRVIGEEAPAPNKRHEERREYQVLVGGLVRFDVKSWPAALDKMANP